MIQDCFTRTMKKDKRMVFSTIQKPPYKEYLTSDHWIKTRRRAGAQLGSRCEICDSNKEIEAHHNNYSNLGKEDPKRDLVLLCRKCHNRFHSIITPDALSPRTRRRSKASERKACSLCSRRPHKKKIKYRHYGRVGRRKLTICNLCYEVMKPRLIAERMSYASELRRAGAPQLAALRALRQRASKAAELKKRINNERNKTFQPSS